jgi:hypothetical protein
MWATPKTCSPSATWGPRRTGSSTLTFLVFLDYIEIALVHRSINICVDHLLICILIIFFILFVYHMFFAF